MSTAERQIVYRPKPPGKVGRWTIRLSGFYLVTREAEIIAAYHPTYFRSAREVVADFIDLFRSEEDWDCQDNDYVVWSCPNRVVAVVRWRAMKEEQHMEFPEPTPSPGLCLPWPGWPTREEWIKSGRGDLWWTEPTLPPRPAS